jgi:hypothetical protein
MEKVSCRAFYHSIVPFIWFDKGKYGKPEQVKWWKGNAKK